MGARFLAPNSLSQKEEAGAVFDMIVPMGRVWYGAGNPWMEAGLGMAGRTMVAVGSLNAVKGGTGEVLGDTGGDRENCRRGSTAGRDGATYLEMCSSGG